jgi:hypothetical protein
MRNTFILLFALTVMQMQSINALTEPDNSTDFADYVEDDQSPSDSPWEAVREEVHQLRRDLAPLLESLPVIVEGTPRPNVAAQAFVAKQGQLMVQGVSADVPVKSGTLPPPPPPRKPRPVVSAPP